MKLTDFTIKVKNIPEKEFKNVWSDIYKLHKNGGINIVPGNISEVDFVDLMMSDEGFNIFTDILATGMMLITMKQISDQVTDN